jgi:uncharacterized protein (TIGR02217 family)
MSTPIFGPLPGLISTYSRGNAWEGILVQTSASQIEARQQQQSFARYSADLSFDYLTMQSRGSYTNAIAAQNLQYVIGFQNSLGGGLSSFFYRDQEDNTAIGSVIGTGDGVTTSFQAVRYWGSNAQPVYGFDTRGAISYGSGYVQPASYAQAAYSNGVQDMSATFDSETGIITYSSAPASGHALTADFTYLYRCRILENSLTFGRLWNTNSQSNLSTPNGYYTLKSFKIIQVLAS